MALGRLIIILTVVAYAVGDTSYEIEAENKAKKAVASEKEQRPRSASRGSFQKLAGLTQNRTDSKSKPRRGKENVRKVFEALGARKGEDNNMLNDNEGLAVNQKTTPDNESDPLSKKINALRGGRPAYEAPNKYNLMSQATGVFCNFESATNGSIIDLCMWEWNATVSRQGLGFRVATAEMVKAMNESSRDYKFGGPKADADGNVGGEEINCVHAWCSFFAFVFLVFVE